MRCQSRQLRRHKALCKTKCSGKDATRLKPLPGFQIGQSEGGIYGNHKQHERQEICYLFDGEQKEEKNTTLQTGLATEGLGNSKETRTQFA